MNDDHFTDTLRSVLNDPPAPASTVDDAQWTAQTTQTIRRRRRARNLTLGTLAAAAVTAGIIVPTVFASSGAQHADAPVTRDATSAPAPTAARPGTVLSEDTIVNMIMTAAAACKDPTPTTIQYVYGTRNALSTLVSGDTVNGADGQVQSVLVQATGHFAMPVNGPVAGYADETGTAISLIINPQTGEVTDSGINKTPVDLTPLGQVFHPAVPKHAKWPPPTVAKWQVLKASPEARSVVISVQQRITTAGCPAGAKATATETSSTIRLHVTVKYKKAPVCSGVARMPEVRIPLHSPVGDRKIEGAGHI